MKEVGPGPLMLDTSALYAVFDRDDHWHGVTAEAWGEVLHSQAPLLVTNYVLVEMHALLGRRLGVAAVAALHDHVLPWVSTVWVDESLHREAQSALRVACRRDLSLVDCTSFVCMRRLGVKTAFTIDRHFEQQGFEVVPRPERRSRGSQRPH